MNQYPLQTLLNVRQFREKSADLAVRNAERALHEAEDAYQRAKEMLQQWRKWRVEEEDRRYTAIIGKKITLKQLDDFKAGLAALASEEVTKISEVTQAEQKVEQCRPPLEQAKEAAKQAHKNTTKLDIHKEAWLEEEKKEAERAADLELEEFSKAGPSLVADDV